MTNTKPWYTSKTIWGSLIAMLAGISSAFGFDFDASIQSGLVDGILIVIAAAGSLMAIYGRLSAIYAIE
jgi:hypothetical protein